MQNSCNARARVRARGTLTLIFHKRKHFIFHLPFLLSRRLRQKVQEKVQQKRNYLGHFYKNVGDFPKNVGDLSKNVGVFLRYLRRYLYPTYSPSASIFRLHRRTLLLLQAMVPLQNWACLQLRKITFALQNWRIYNLTSCLKAQKKRVCQNLTHPLS